MSDLSDAVSLIESSFSQTLTADLRFTAVNSGWPQEVADKVSAKADGGHVFISMEDARDVVDWEYGTQERPAVPVIRKWLARIKDTHTVDYWEKVSETVWATVI